MASLVAEHAERAAQKLPTNPDEICRLITLCKDEAKQCTLYGWGSSGAAASAIVPSPTTISRVREWSSSAAAGLASLRGGVVDHLPEFDHDKDRYSPVATLRGSNWRGKDCDDHDATTYPGRRGTDEGASSCNGISAADQQRLCGGSGRRGLLGAHGFGLVTNEWAFATC